MIDGRHHGLEALVNLARFADAVTSGRLRTWTGYSASWRGWRQFIGSPSVDRASGSRVPQCCVVRDRRSIRLRRNDDGSSRTRLAPVSGRWPCRYPRQEDGAHLPGLPLIISGLNTRCVGPNFWVLARTSVAHRRRARDPIGRRSGQRRVLADRLAVSDCELRFSIDVRAGRTHHRLCPCRPARASGRGHSRWHPHEGTAAATVLTEGTNSALGLEADGGLGIASSAW